MAVKNETLTSSDKIINFIQKNRKIMVITLASIAGSIVVMALVFFIRDRVISRAFNMVESFDRRYQGIVQNVEENQEPNAEELGLLLEELANFEEKNSGYAAARAYAITAAIYEGAANWAEAETAWTNAAREAAKTYFGPVAYFNAAVAAEEQGKDDGAIELYNKALDYGNTFSAAARAQFSIGRIYETKGDTASATATYQALVARWPQDQIWVSLAHSRMLALSMGQ